MITEPFWQVQALLQLARAEVDAGNWTAANASLAAAVRRTDALEAGEQFFVARDLALAEAHAGDADAAVRAIELPGNTMFRVEGFAEAVQELARQGWQDAARAVLARAASQALAIADEGDRTYFAARLAVAGAKIGDATGTAALLAALDPYERATTLADIALNR